MAMNPNRLTKAKAHTSWRAAPCQSTHNTGGTSMGTNPGNSVTNKSGQVGGVDNLFIMSALLWSHNAEYNPTGPAAADRLYGRRYHQERLCQAPSKTDPCVTAFRHSQP
jgi:choline dehydrogenase-like flavoprotein